MSAYSDKLKHPKWQKKRLQILNRDRFSCRLCGDKETTLHIHHKYYEDGCDPWEYPNQALVTLCEHCHKEVEHHKDSIEDFSEIKVYKSNNWKGGSRIMFLSNCRSGIFTMRIYDGDGKFCTGYNFPWKEQMDIIKIMKFALR